MDRRRKKKLKRESRIRCVMCGGPLKVDNDYAKTPHIMVRKRRCVKCGQRYESVEVVKILDENPPKQGNLFE